MIKRTLPIFCAMLTAAAFVTAPGVIQADEPAESSQPLQVPTSTPNTGTVDTDLQVPDTSVAPTLQHVLTSPVVQVGLMFAQSGATCPASEFPVSPGAGSAEVIDAPAPGDTRVILWESE